VIILTREEAQQVLEHLDDLADAQQWEIDMHATQYGEGYKPHRMRHMREQLANTNKTIETLRARLAQPEPEPVAWMHIMDNTEGIEDNGTGIVSITQKRKHPFGKPGIDFSKSYPVTSTPLYTAPPQREWQWLTDEEISELIRNTHNTGSFVRAIEAKLKEKNA
jgi:hypothetical protein